MENVKYIGNLQLLEALPNIEKSNMDFDIWLNKTIPSSALNEYKKKHYIPNVDLNFTNFDIFIEKREELLIAALVKELKP